MIYGSVCSGIEAASVAWHPLGWRAAWLAEIEAYPAAALAHHYPDVPNLGDMTKIARSILVGDTAAPDVLAGGTPCQAFSVAGLREGLDDARGQLTLAYVRLLDAIDYVRGRSGKPPAIAVWENVPGVLSDKTNAFGCLLAGLAGEDVELKPPGKKWANAGCVFGPARTVAWRTFDAQYFGLAQRRRRVFVVASARKGFDPVKVLFEFDGVRRDTAPSREAWEETAGTLASRTGAGGFPGTDEACSGYLQPVAFGGNSTAGPIDIATARNACSSASGRMDFETETFLVQPVCVTGDITHTLKADGFDGSEDGTGRGQPIVAMAQPPICFSAKDYGGDATVDLSPTLRAGGHANSHANAGVMPAIAFAENSRGELRLEGGDGQRTGTLSTGGGKPGQGMPVIAFQSSQSGVRLGETHATLDANNGPRRHNGVVEGLSVRRLTPVECERLQGFPDGYTAVRFSKKPAKDGPRYKAIGNSMAVPCMAWIGKRIAAMTGAPA